MANIYKIKCINDNKTFESIKDCAKYYEISGQIVRNCLVNKNATKKGLRFESEDYDNRGKKIQNKIIPKYTPLVIGYDYSKLNLREYISTLFYKIML